MIKSAIRLCFAALILAVNLVASPADDWLPVTKADLEMKEYPGHPGLPAVFLYTRQANDDTRFYLQSYFRIKVLTEAGRDHANVQVGPFWGDQKLRDLKARVIHPDGTIIPFTGQVFESVVARYKDAKLIADSFSLPAVTVGSIIEYQYRLFRTGNYLHNAQWMLESSLFTKEAHFSYKPNSFARSAWMLFLVDNEIDSVPIEHKDGTVTLDLHDVKAFETEPLMPPENKSRSYIDFYYVYSSEPLDKFWENAANNWGKAVETYLSKNSKLTASVPALVSQDAAPEAKLRTLYGKVQKMRNLSFEKELTSKEIEHQKLGVAATPDEVFLRGYGYSYELLRVFVEMARAAGFEAYPVRVSNRQRAFFLRELRDFWQLDSEIAYVRDGKKEYWLDPSTPYCPFGLLPWYHTDVKGVRSGKDGAVWMDTPKPNMDQATTLREGELKLNRDGSAEGELTFTYTGQEALYRRLSTILDDPQARRTSNEKELKGWLPVGATVELVNSNGWNNAEEPIVLSYKVQIPVLSIATKTRLLLPTSIFPGLHTHPFVHETRSLEIYFGYPYKTREVISYTLEEGLKVTSLPAQHHAEEPFGIYGAMGEQSSDGRKLQLRRSLSINAIILSPENYYSDLRKFFNVVAAGDEEPAVLEISTPK